MGNVGGNGGIESMRETICDRDERVSHVVAAERTEVPFYLARLGRILAEDAIGGEVISDNLVASREPERRLAE